jgi:hypothetical protein
MEGTPVDVVVRGEALELRFVLHDDLKMEKLEQ